MSKIFVYIFSFDVVLFLYAFSYGIILNTLLFRNRYVIKEHFKEHGYKLHFGDNIDGKFCSRKKRLALIKEIADNNAQIKNRKLLTVILRMFYAIYFIFGMLFLSLLTLAFLIFADASH